MSILDKLARHLIGWEGTGLRQIHDISHAKMSVSLHLVSGARVVSARGSSREVGDALTIIGKHLAHWRVRTPKKKTTGTSAAAPPTTTEPRPSSSIPPSVTISTTQIAASQTTAHLWLALLLTIHRPLSTGHCAQYRGFYYNAIVNDCRSNCIWLS